MKWTTMICVVAVAAIVTEAQAGKLADGFRGLPFGDAAFLDQPPHDGCATSPDESSKWTCSTTIGKVPVVVNYVVMEGLYVGVQITTEGHTNASELLSTLTQAYGRARRTHDWDDSSMGDRMWFDGVVVCSWNWNQYSDLAEVYIIDRDVYAEAEKRQSDRAAQGVGDL